MGKIKEKSKRVVRVASHQTKRATVKTVKAAKTTAALTAKGAKRVARTKTYQKAHKSYKKTHHKIAETPHKHLMEQSPRYAAWHNWQYKRLHHGHVHATIAFAWVALVVLLVSSVTPSLSALSTWTQTDWSGGQGTSTENQFSNKENIEVGDGSFSISPRNHLDNGSFEENLNGWHATSSTTGTFSSPLVYSAGSNTYSTTTGDLNGDGYPDIIAPNYQSHTVSVFINNKNAGFEPKVDYNTGNGPVNSIIADVDGDGDNDIVTSNFDAGTISALKNNGNGTFNPKTDFVAGTIPYGIQAINLNNDSFVDIVVSNYNANTVSLLTNTGDGAFGSRVTLPAASSPSKLDVGDINNDGYDDIAVSGYAVGNNKISVIINNRDGSFAPKVDYTVGTRPYGIKIKDMNGDNRPDIIVANYSSGNVSYLANQGDGSFAPKVDFSAGSGPYGLKVEDINGDGHQDIIVASFGSQSASILLGQGSGVFSSPQNIPSGASTRDLDVADLNNDGAPDLIVSHSASMNRISVFFNNSNIKFSSNENQTYKDSAKSVKLISSSTSGVFHRPMNVGAGAQRTLEMFVYTNGSEVTSDDASLYVNNAVVSTVYTSTNEPGWYKLSTTVTGTGTLQKYGIQVEPDKTLYIDNASLKDYTTGSLTSAIYDVTFGADWGTLLYETSGSGTVGVKVRSGNNADMSDASDFAGCPEHTSGTDLTGQTCMTDNHRYVQYQVNLVSNAATTPVFESISIHYTPWDQVPPPVNASSIIMKKSAGGEVINSNDWTNGSTPYFEWTAAEDDEDGQGIRGYCLYLGQDSTADPVTTKGLLGTGSLDTNNTCPFAVAATHIDTATANYIGTALSSSASPYYLNIKAIDEGFNVFDGESAQFQFRFDNTSPKNPEFITAPSQFVSSKEVTLTWPTSGNDAASDAHAGLAGLQYRIGASGTWFGAAHNGSQDTSDLLANNGSYTTVDPEDFDVMQEGNNVVYFRTWDQAGNVSTTYVTTVIKLNTSAPTSPLNVIATPSVNSTNWFAFSWVEPSSFHGLAENLTYCYTVNTLPTNNTCTYTDAGVTSLAAGAYATQPGENTFYVVAKDETGSVNYATAANVTFTANAPAPGIPLNVEIADISTKATSTWKLALSWSPPANVGVGVSTYKIYRSTNNSSFTQIASTAGTSYVDGNLSGTRYYYRINACDNSNNCGAQSGTVSETPTGKFTEPPAIISQPSVTVSTRSATFNWTTDREGDSRIQYGIGSGQYFKTEASNSELTKNHEITLQNLDPGTTYHYKARWTDEDGNVGQSSELTFTTLPAPVIKNVTIKRVTVSTAILEFTATDATAIKVYYGKSEEFGGVERINTSRSESTYTLELDGLDDGTTYYYGINPIDTDGHEYRASRIDTFATPARPRISNLRFQPVSGEPTSTQEITWNTNVPTSSLIRYQSANVPGREVSDSTLKVDHKIIVKGLADDTEYSFVAESRDRDGNLAVSDVTNLRTSLDTRPPKISDIVVETSVRGTGSEANGQIIVSWRTDEPASSQVAFSEGSLVESLNSRSAEDTSLATEHVVIISNLDTSRVYTVQPVSRDRSLNSASGEKQSAIIGRASNSIIDIVLNSLRRVFGF